MAATVERRPSTHLGGAGEQPQRGVVAVRAAIRAVAHAAARLAVVVLGQRKRNPGAQVVQGPQRSGSWGHVIFISVLYYSVNMPRRLSGPADPVGWVSRFRGPVFPLPTC